jgi:hypothetical protein
VKRIVAQSPPVVKASPRGREAVERCGGRFRFEIHGGAVPGEGEDEEDFLRLNTGTKRWGRASAVARLSRTSFRYCSLSWVEVDLAEPGVRQDSASLHGRSTFVSL